MHLCVYVHMEGKVHVCMHLCMYVHMEGEVHACMHLCVYVHMWIGIFLRFSPFLETYSMGLSLNPVCHSARLSLQIPRIHLSPPLQCRPNRCPLQCLTVDKAVEDWNSGPRAYMASIFLIEPSPQTVLCGS